MRVGDIVEASVTLKISEIVHKVDKSSLVWGHDHEGNYICVPLKSVIEPEELYSPDLKVYGGL